MMTHRVCGSTVISARWLSGHIINHICSKLWICCYSSDFNCFRDTRTVCNFLCLRFKRENDCRFQWISMSRLLVCTGLTPDCMNAALRCFKLYCQNPYLLYVHLCFFSTKKHQQTLNVWNGTMGMNPPKSIVQHLSRWLGLQNNLLPLFL